MTVEELERLTPYQRALLDELRKFRGEIHDLVVAVSKAIE